MNMFYVWKITLRKLHLLISVEGVKRRCRCHSRILEATEPQLPRQECAQGTNIIKNYNKELILL
jgi:hypothetical protein